MNAPASAWRAGVLLARLQLRRQLNQFAASLTRMRAARAAKKAASRVSPARLLTGLVGLIMLASFSNLAIQAMRNIEHELGSSLVREAVPAGQQAGAAQRKSFRFTYRALPPAPGSVLAPGVIHGAAFLVSLLFISALLVALASREISGSEWDLEWLATLPLPMSTLLMSRLIARVATNSSGFLVLAPFLSVLAWFCGYRWTAPLLGAGCTIALLLVAGTVQTILDTGLRLSLPPHRLRNFHALVSIVSLPILFLSVAMSFETNAFLFKIAAALPGWAQWLPPGLVVRALASADRGVATLWSGLLVAEVALVVAAGLALLAWQLRNGVVSVGVREAGARAPAKRRVAPIRLAHGSALVSPVQRRELLLLGRDRTFLVQTLVLPLTIVGMQLMLNLHSNIFAGAIDQPATIAVIAFALATYTLMFSAFQTLNAEGQALWILYCVPQSLEAVLRQKARLWSAVALVYPVALFVIAVVLAGGVSSAFLGTAAIALVGVPIFASIATALGVFACDPLAQEVRRRVRPTYLYLYMVLVSLYGYAIFVASIPQRGALVILTALLAVALWQKARDQLPYLLDPTASPPAHVSVSDGLIAALLFFVAQALIALVEMQVVRPHALTASMVWIAFCGAGALTYAAVRLVYWRTRTEGVPRIFGNDIPHALLWGVGGGVAVALAGFIYIEVALAFDLFPALRRAGPLADRQTTLWLAAVAIAAAPIFEEFIFRGLIFGGLRRSFGFLPAALASAAIFAIVHPLASVIPVFVMGLGAALAYERTRMLAAPMTVHAIYNAAVLAFQWHAIWT